ncbi:hypothetical protein K7432_014388, partial [Basidiobolus ranarum]
LAYCGVIFVESRLYNVDERCLKESELVGHGSMLALSDNKGLLAQRNGDGSIRNYATLRIYEENVLTVEVTVAPVR